MQIWYEIVFSNNKVRCFDTLVAAADYCKKKKVRQCICFQCDDDYSNSKFYDAKKDLCDLMEEVKL